MGGKRLAKGSETFAVYERFVNENRKISEISKKSGDFGRNLKLEEKGVNERIGE
jgi:hypothetical protein